ncbi:MAG: hypothetical protein QG638_2225 [Pseudomonadota bacterium]|nr:hypothetical protein [Pseudomonadota bacterium]
MTKGNVIPGVLDWRLLTDTAAADHASRDIHRPDTPEGRRIAILELVRQGLKARDIAQALRLPLAEVLEVLAGEATP